ncbi:FAD-binding oxidoreductase [Ornithinicoccus halotolerans]|uniref:FAD-binding oxidoreductase n=1 Tax=Ornithinicoccus halotolerans TaxID=1748220 RepID=UPI001297E438|nr:FAD-binding oxidoreductase [Ornithinicoccus halotolerans]
MAEVQGQLEWDDELSERVTGRVVRPGDRDYDALRAVLLGWVDARPLVIVRVVDAQDVAAVLAVARDHELPVAVRSGGHSMAGHSGGDRAVVLDLRELTGLEIDVAGRTAWVQAGLTAGEYTARAAEHGLATGFGDSGSVGISGLLLGGGVGYLSRRFGLTVDQLLAAEVVMADGRVLQVDEEHHPDLFWAIRGGGGGFGVVTGMRLRLHPVSAVVGGMLVLPASPEVLAGAVAAAETAPEELSVIIQVMVAPPVPFLPEAAHGRTVVLLMMCYSGPAEQAEQVLAPFRSLATPLADQLAPITYAEMFPPEPEGFRPRAVATSAFRDAFDVATAEQALARLEVPGDGVAEAVPMRGVQVRVLGGAIDRAPADATAYVHRGRRMMLVVNAGSVGPEGDGLAQDWVAGTGAALRDGDGSGYLNFLGVLDADRLREAFPGPAWERLRRVKRDYDPGDLFRAAHRIPPAG